MKHKYISINLSKHAYNLIIEIAEENLLHFTKVLTIWSKVDNILKNTHGFIFISAPVIHEEV